MSGTKKGLLFGCGGLLVLAAAAIVGIRAFVNYKYGRTLDAKAVEGRDFGATHSKQGCLDHILSKSEKAKGALPSVESLLGDDIFISSCLEARAPDTTFCSKVPGIDGEFGKTLEGEVYEEKICQTLGYGEHDPTCKMVYSAKQKFCWKK